MTLFSRSCSLREIPLDFYDAIASTDLADTRAFKRAVDAIEEFAVPLVDSNSRNGISKPCPMCGVYTQEGFCVKHLFGD